MKVRTLVVITAAVIAAVGGAAAPRAATPDEAGTAEGVALLVLPISGEEKDLGDQVRLMLINKARRLGAVVYDPGSVAEVLSSADPVSVDAPPEKLAALGRDKFKADLVVAGHVRGKGPYAIRLVAARTGDSGRPLVLDKTYECGYHQVIPLEMAKAVYEIFRLRIPEDPLRMLREDPQIEQRWREAPNLVKNPGLETPNAAGAGPADWQPIEKQMSWAPNPDGPGKVLKYDMDEATAGSYGLDFYSDWIAIQPGATYRFSCRYKSEGPTPKVFLKGYHEFPPQEGFPPAGRSPMAGVGPADRRETYRRQVHPGGEKRQWHTVVADFIPEATRPDQQPTWLKVDLYAYWPKGVLYWDDVVLKKVRDGPEGGPKPAAGEKTAGDRK